MPPKCEPKSATRGQLGLGMMLVFIALVLIAAIASGVLINTSSELETRAEATGQDSTQQVADRIHVDIAIGYTTNSFDAFENTDKDDIDELEDGDEAIHRVEIIVQPGPGTDAIDLQKATVEFVGSSAETLTHVGVEDGYDSDSKDFDDGVGLEEEDSGFFATRDLEDESANDVIFDDERTKIVIPLGTYDGDTGWVDSGDVSQPEPLEPRADAHVTIVTAQGSQTVLELNVPNSLTRDAAAEL